MVVKKFIKLYNESVDFGDDPYKKKTSQEVFFCVCGGATGNRTLGARMSIPATEPSPPHNHKTHSFVYQSKMNSPLTKVKFLLN